MPKRNLVLVIGLLVAAFGLVMLAKRPARRETGPLTQTYELIKDRYVRPIDDDTLRRGAVEGMIATLDPFSAYIPPGRMVAIEQRLQGWESGSGLRLEIVDGQILVIGPIKGSPADAANLCTGDRIVAVDGTPVAGTDLTGVYRMLAGKVGSTVQLTVFRVAGGEEVLKLTRAKFAIETLTGLHRDESREWVYVIDPRTGTAYVRAREFVEDTAAKLQQCLRQLARFDGLVLDLRDNPGGPLESAVSVCDLFLDEGTIVTVVGRKKPPEKYEATADGTYPRKIRLVCLVNSETASAAELVAGALRRQDRAVLVGSRTHGKGAIQTILDLPGKLGQINLTVSEFRIGGTEVISRRRGARKWGIDPHEQVVILPSGLDELRRLRVEAEVFRAPPNTRAPSAPPEGPGSLLERIKKLDLQLARAMEILRAPAEYEAILKRAAAAREAEARLRPKPDQS